MHVDVGEQTKISFPKEIPTTIAETTLGSAHQGTIVNLETDMISRTVVHSLRHLTRTPSTVNFDSLRKAGFID